MDYGMSAGVLNLNVRAALAGYLLRRWNVDCTEDASLIGGEYQLLLRNQQSLYCAENLAVALVINQKEINNVDNNLINKLALLPRSLVRRFSPVINDSAFSASLRSS
jgi:hypothetical protein